MVYRMITAAMNILKYNYPEILSFRQERKKLEKGVSVTKQIKSAVFQGR